MHVKLGLSQCNTVVHENAGLTGTHLVSGGQLAVGELALQCRRHQVGLHMKHFALSLTGPSVSHQKAFICSFLSFVPHQLLNLPAPFAVDSHHNDADLCMCHSAVHSIGFHETHFSQSDLSLAPLLIWLQPHCFPCSFRHCVCLLLKNCGLISRTAGMKPYGSGKPSGPLAVVVGRVGRFVSSLRPAGCTPVTADL